MLTSSTPLENDEGFDLVARKRESTTREQMGA
jgi:hypothetical protein